MSWDYEDYDYLWEILYEKVKELLEKAGIDVEEINDVDCEIEYVEGYPVCGAYSGKIFTEDDIEHDFTFVVYKKPKLYFNPIEYRHTFGSSEEEYDVGIHEVVLNDGRVIKGSAFAEIKKTFEEDFKSLEKEAEKTKIKLQKKAVKDHVGKFQSTKKRMMV